MDKREFIAQFNPDAIMWDDLDEAIVGLTTNGVVVYDVNKIQEVLYAGWKKDPTDDVTMDDVIDYVEYNILGAYVGEFTPVHITSIP
jgi:hypothetical protein